MAKILAIDDNNDNLISLKAIINDAFPGSTMYFALNGQKGIELAVENNPDVILLDIIMPEMDGFEVCRYLKQDERVSDIPVVFLTALKGDKENRIKALNVGAEGFLSKPIDETELIAQVRAMVKIKNATEQKRTEKERLTKLVEERTNLLAKSEARLKGIFNNLQDAYFQTDLTGSFTVISLSATKMYGYSSSELIGQKAQMLYADSLIRDSLLLQLQSKGKVEDFVCQGKKKDGSCFWVSMNVQFIYGDNGQVVGTEGMIRDISDRINSERALRESEERFQLLFNKAPLGYQSLDINGHFIEVNQQWLDTLGYNREEVIGKWFGDFLSPDYQDGFRKRFPLFKAQGHIHSEFEMVHKNGTKLFIAFDGRIGYDLEGEFKQTHCILQDITEKRKSEIALRESEEKYRMMVDLLPDAVIIHQGGRIVFANTAALRTVGADSFNQLIERPLMDYVHPDFRNRSLERIKQIYSTSQPSKFIEEKFVTLNDEVIDVEVIGIPVMYSGKPAIQTIIRNITMRKKTESLLKESEERFKLVFKAANVAQSMTLPSGEVNANQAFCNMFGYTEAELSGIKWQDLTFPDEVETDQKLIDLILSGERNGARRIKRYVHKNGSILWGDVSYTLIRDPSGKPLHFITTIVDVTERKQAEDALRLNNTRLGLAMDVANLSWWEMDIETGSVAFEKRKAEMLGYPPEKFKHYTHFMELVHPEDYEPAMNAMRNHLSGAVDKYEVEYRIKAASGDYKWFYDIGSVVNRDDQGKPLTVSGLVLDISERKKSELELKEINARLGLILENMPIAIWDWDLDADTWIATSKYYTMLGYEAEPGFSDREIWIKRVHQEERELVLSKIRKVLQHDDDDYSYDARMLHADGTYRWQTVIGHVVSRDENGKATRMLGVRVDIDERKRAELALKESNELNASLLQTIPFAIDIVDEHGTILFQNEMLKSLFERDAIGQKCWELYRDDKRQCNDCPLLKGIKIGETETYESCGVLGGRTFEISHTGMLFDGKKALLEIFQDITERKQAERALKESVHLFQGLFNASPDAVVLIDPHHPTVAWPIIDCNEAYCRMNGYEYKELIGQTIDILNATKGSPEERTYFLDNLREVGVIHKEGVHRHKDGHHFPIEISTSIVTINGREMVLGIDRDITHRKKMEAELIASKEKAEESDRLKSAFLANMSHEIRTPLNSIIGFSELLIDTDFDETQRAEFAQMINENGNSLLSILSDIMDLSKIEAGQIQVKKTEFIANRLVTEIKNEFSFKAKANGIEIRLNLPDSDVLLCSDESKIRQILVNLLSNALKFTPQGYIEIGLSVLTDHVQFHVKDTGIGVPPDFHQQIFERFRQVDMSFTRKYGGTGLGLAISRSLAELLGGEIWMESQEGKGSVFYFNIPKRT